MHPTPVVYMSAKANTDDMDNMDNMDDKDATDDTK